MTRFTTALVAFMASLCGLALVPVTAASADTSHSGLAVDRTGRIVQGTLVPGGPRTWHVLVGASRKTERFRPRGITRT